jgi:glycosyltransferase involved in cell wall biosynthesis
MIAIWCRSERRAEIEPDGGQVMKIAFVDINDPTDPRAWSGIPIRMIEGFSRHADIATFGKINRGVRQLYFGHKIITRLAGKRFDEQRTTLSTKLFSYRVRKALRSIQIQAIIAPSSLPVTLIQSSAPVAFWTDACFGAMPGYYDDFSRLCQRSRSDGHVQERAALAHCHLAIYASDWAADHCRRLYPEYADKVRVVPFGANLDPYYDERKVDELFQARSDEKCRLLFVGVDWERKGGVIALDAARILNKRGVPTTLTVVGCNPFTHEEKPPFVKVLGFLDRTSPGGSTRLQELFVKSDFLVLPSRAEAYGIVLCEAAAFALPSVASNTGGIPTIVEDGITGRLLPPDADGEEYADVLAEVFRNKGAYRRLALSAFDKYRRQLNWDTACKAVVSALSEIV